MILHRSARFMLCFVLLPLASSMVIPHQTLAADVDVIVNAASIVRPLAPQLFGINTAAWDSNFRTQSRVELLKKSSICSFRYPGGSWADGFDWTKPKWPGMPVTKDFGILLNSLNGDGDIILNYGSGTPQMDAAWAAYCISSPNSTVKIGVDNRGIDWKTAGYWAQLRSSAPVPTDDGLNSLRASHPAAYPISHFEVGNECYGSWEYDVHPQKQDPVTYAQFYMQTRALIRMFAPYAQVGAVVTSDEYSYGNGQESVVNPVSGAARSGWTAVLFSTLNALHGVPDFVIYHCYPEQPGQENDQNLLSASLQWKPVAVSIRAMLTDYFHGKAGRTVLDCTENNNVTFNPGKQSVSLVDALYLADSFGSIASTEFQGYYWWCLGGGISEQYNNSSSLYGWRNYGDYGVLSAGKTEPYTPPDTPYPTFRVLELIKKFATPGDHLVTVISSDPNIAVYAVTQKSGQLAVLLLNKNAHSSFTADLSLVRYHPTSTAVTWTYGEQEDNNASHGLPSDILQGSLHSAGGKFSFTASPYSINVIVFYPAG